MKLTKKSAYALLGLSIVMELIASSCMEACEAFTKPVPTVVLIICYTIAFWTFSKTLKFVNLSIAYATWTAVGTIGASLIGIFVFHQMISPVGWAAIVVMVFGVFLLNLFGTPKEEPAEDKAGDQIC